MNSKERKRKTFILTIITIIILIIILLINLSCSKDSGIFYEDLYSYLSRNDYKEIDVEESFLKDTDLFDENFICETISYKNNILTFNNCEVKEGKKTTFNEYCTYDGKDFVCEEEDNTETKDELEEDTKVEEETNLPSTDSKEEVKENNNNNYVPPTINGTTLPNEEKPEVEIPTPELPEEPEEPEIPTSNIVFNYSENSITNNNVEVEVTSNNDLLYCISSSNNCTPTDNLTSKINLETEGVHYICVEDKKTLENKCSTPIIIDKTAPVLNEPTIVGTPGNNGWYKTHVVVQSGGAIDNLSGIKKVDIDYPIINYNTASKEVTITATDNAGNTSTKKITLKVDTVAPVIDDLIFYGAPGENDWFISDVTVETPTATDNLSGLQSLNTSSTLFDYETNGTNLVITATDNAGNIQTLTKVMKIDKTPPVITDYNISGTPGLNGWYISELTINQPTATDSGSGINTTLLNSYSITIDYETTGVDVNVEVSDNAGNKTILPVPIKVDLTNPVSGEILLDGEEGDNGWYTSEVEVDTTTGSDSISGINKTELNMELVLGNKLETTVLLTTTDNAGRTTTTSKIIKIDKEIPENGTIKFNGTKKDNDWYITDVAIDIEDGSDSGSGHAGTSVNLLNVNTNTTGTIITIITKDNAGNENTHSETIKIDKDKPSLIIKSDNEVISKGIDYQITNLFESPNYSISEGNISCTIENTKDLDVGNYSSTCTLTGGNGLTDSKTVNFTIEEQPDAIKEVLDGIKSTTNSYIKTTFIPSSNTRIVSEFTFLGPRSATAAWLFSSRKAYKNQMIGIAWNATESLLQFADVSYNLGRTAFVENKRHLIDLSKDGLYLDNKYYTKPTNKVWHGTNELYIFANNQSGSAIGHTNGQAIMHASQVYENNVLVLDLIPIETVSGEIGMYDKVSKTILESVGTFIPIYK